MEATNNLLGNLCKQRTENEDIFFWYLWAMTCEH
jgi:hypothetical protein